MSAWHARNDVDARSQRSRCSRSDIAEFSIIHLAAKGLNGFGQMQLSISNQGLDVPLVRRAETHLQHLDCRAHVVLRGCRLGGDV